MMSNVEFYNLMEMNPCSGAEVDVFSLLKIRPRVDKSGRRILTSYEILGVAPKIDKNGNEIPIVYMIKNRATKVAKPKEDYYKFTYKPKKVKQEQSVIDVLKRNYKKAIISNNDAEAEIYFKLLNESSGGRAEEILGSYFVYSKYYKRMKRQLLIDIFAHFFMIYLNRKSTIKSGVRNKDRLFSAYKMVAKDSESETYEYDSAELGMNFNNPEIGVIQSIKITRDNYDYDSENVYNAIQNDQDLDVCATANQSAKNHEAVEPAEKIKPETQPEKHGFLGSIRSRIIAKNQAKKEKLRAHHMFGGLKQPHENNTDSQNKTDENYKEKDDTKVLI